MLMKDSPIRIKMTLGNIEIVATTSEISEICPGVVIFSTFLLFYEFSEITSENFNIV